MMCFEPLAIYAMSFRPFPMISDNFMEFPMFAHLYLTYCYINGLSMHSPYYSMPIRCAPDSDFVSILFIFADINIPMFRLFIVLADCTITTGLDSDPYGLLVVSDPSDAILTSPRLFLLIFT